MPQRDARRHALSASLLGAALLIGCASPRPADPPPQKRPELVRAITANHLLISFNAGEPGRVMSQLPVTGLAPGESVVGMDFRVARGVLFVLADSGQLYTLDVATAKLTPVGQGRAPVLLKGQRVGVDFNPAVDRIRVVTASGQNWRMHPDSGAWIDADPKQEGLQADGALSFVATDASTGRQPQLAAAGYTYNKDNDKLTTNYAIDLATAQLVRQGSKEGDKPVISPSTGQLYSVGKLGVQGVVDAHLDISDVRNAALAALDDGRGTRLYEISLGDGRARLLGTIGQGQRLLGLAIEP
jgi:Domain of unknown function (DUF4394)